MAIKVQGVTVIDNDRNASFDGTGSIKIPAGTTAQRPGSPSPGELRYNTDLSVIEQYDGSAWAEVGGGGVAETTLTRTFYEGEQYEVSLPASVVAPIIGATKEVAIDNNVTDNAWDVNANGQDYEFHDTSYDYPLSPGKIFDIENASYDSVSFDVSSQMFLPHSVAFNIDGTKMYVIGNLSESVHQYTLSTGFDLSTASYDNVSFSVSSEESSPRGLVFNTDGTKMFVVGNDSESVHQYTLSTGFDVSTASYDNVSFSVSSEESSPTGLTFNPDGTKMFVVGESSDSVYQYTLSSGFDLSTALYDNIFLPISFNAGYDFNDAIQVPGQLNFNSDGTKLFILSYNNEKVQIFNLSLPYDISNANLNPISFDVSSEDGSPWGLAFSTDGTKMFVVGSASDSVYQYTTGEIKASLVDTAVSFTSDDIGKRIVGNGGDAVLTDTDGSYVVNTDFNDLSEIPADDWSLVGLDTLSSNSGLITSGLIVAFDISAASYDNDSFDVSSEDGLPTGLTFNSDGTKMFVVGSSSDSVHQYSLSSGFDLSTASYDNVSFDVSSEETSPSSLTFNSDGTKMIVIGNSSDSVHSYTLASGFDLSTASYDSVSFDVSSQDSNLRGFAFNTDGTKMFVIGVTSGVVFQYTLSTAFDLSTASYDNVSFDVSSEDASPRGLVFNPDGTKMFVIGTNSDSVHQYTLSTGFDISTASYDSVSFDVSSEEATPEDLTFNNDGTKMFVIGFSDLVLQYTTRGLAGGASAFSDQYTTAITKSSTNTTNWTDVNSMTADDSPSDNEVYYAISNDDRETWYVVKDSEGERPIVRNNAGTWEMNESLDYSSATWISAPTNDEYYALQEAIDPSVAGFVIGFDVSTASYDSVSFDVSSQISSGIAGFVFSADGTKMFIAGGNFSPSVFQYTLATAFDLSTASYDSVSFDVSSQDDPFKLAFNTDGTKMLILGYSGVVFQYTLSTGFDISTASYDSVSFDATSQDDQPYGLVFNPDGTKMFMVGIDLGSVHQYTLSTGFDLTTASYDSISFSVLSQDESPFGLAFNTDGTKMLILGDSTDSVHSYTLSTGFDLSTASYDSVSFDVSSQISNNPIDIGFSNDGTKMYILDAQPIGTVILYQYTTTDIGNHNTMTSTQLNAASDADQISLNDDLDLAITMKYISTNPDRPTSDGVSINYDGNVATALAVPGTDYTYTVVNNDTVVLESLADQNLKLRIL